jgi:alpha-tubulin suppressor-like RCC1 family protein
MRSHTILRCRVTQRLVPVLAPALMVAALGCREDAESPTAPEAEPALDVTPAQALSFRQISAGTVHTCGVTSDNRAFCWGTNFGGALGDGTPAPVQRLTPVAVAGGLQFRQVSASGYHTCGVTTDNRGYCWGENQFGELGDGTTTTHSLTPVAVAGGLLFRQIRTGGLHNCGVTTDNRAYCWGDNNFGKSGGTQWIERTPVAVPGGLQFRQVTAGTNHSCGVTAAKLVYCWGGNYAGQLGIGTADSDPHPRPVRVAGGLQFLTVSAGSAHTCGVSAGNLAFCWGANDFGQLGDGTTTPRLTPVAVAGGRRFLRVSAGGSYTCAENPFNVAFCWGENRFGQLGDNTTTQRLTPVRVVGGFRFGQLSAGQYRHTCAVTTGNLAYCWGENSYGQLGDGTLKIRRRPTAVAGAM